MMKKAMVALMVLSQAVAAQRMNPMPLMSSIEERVQV
jgi:hypothetical protein